VVHAALFAPSTSQVTPWTASVYEKVAVPDGPVVPVGAVMVADGPIVSVVYGADALHAPLFRATSVAAALYVVVVLAGAVTVALKEPPVATTVVTAVPVQPAAA
jgi:hypothetical protein